MKTKTISKLSLLSVLLLTVPACWNDKKEDVPAAPSADVLDDGSEVLISIDGKPHMTVKSFESLWNDLTSENEQVKMMAQFMPDIKEQVFHAKKQAIVHGEWAKREGVADSDEFKKKHKMILDGAKDQIHHEFFIKHHKADVTDDEVKKFYDDIKTKDPQLVESPAGTKAEYVIFKTKSAADEFAAKVTSATFNTEAKEQDLKIKALDTVTEHSFQLGSDVKKAILEASVPSVIVAKDDADKKDLEYWVVNVKSKEPAKYHDFDKVKEPLKQHLQKQKVEEVTTKETEKYADKIGVVVNKKYFDDVKKQREEEARKAAEQMAKAQEQAQAKQNDNNKPAQHKELAGGHTSRPAAA